MTNSHLFVLSGPSGVGKSTIAQAVIGSDPSLRQAVTHTSREPREAEVNGCHYHFVNETKFLEMRDQGEFLESVQIFGNYYGTSRKAVQHLLEQYFDTVLIIDWQGARDVRQSFDNSTSIFLLPPSLSSLRERLTDRADTDHQSLALRIKNAKLEMSHYTEYDFVIVNDSFDTTVEQIHQIIDGVRANQAVTIGPSKIEIESMLALE